MPNCNFNGENFETEIDSVLHICTYIDKKWQLIKKNEIVNNYFYGDKLLFQSVTIFQFLLIKL